MVQTETAVLDQKLEPSAPVEVTILPQDIPKRYEERLYHMYSGQERPILYVMLPFDETTERWSVSASGVKEQVAPYGIDSQFDSQPAPEGVVSHDNYLQMIKEGYFPVATDSPEHAVHDYVFHGFGFISFSPEVAELVKHAASKALEGDERAKSQTVAVIDSLSFVMCLGTQHGSDAVIKDIATHLKDLAQTVGNEGVQVNAFAEEIKAGPDTPAKKAYQHMLDTSARVLRMYDQVQTAK